MSTRLTVLPAAAALCLLGAPAAAHAGTVALDKPCYVEGEPIVATGSGFSPNSQLTLTSSAGGDPFPAAVADADGGFLTRLEAPAPTARGARPTDVTSTTLTVVDPLNGTLNTATPFQLANFAVDRGQSRNPRSVRTWYFSGFPTGSSIYGHFRFGGRTVANHRFGTAAGACGLLHARARGIPVARLKTGTWTIQVDTAEAYKRHRVPSLELKLSLSLR
jgi:hypothetical protein